MRSQWPAIAAIAEKVQKGELKAADLVNKALKTIEEKKEYIDELLIDISRKTYTRR